jgi:hypothetical protein
LGFLHYPTLEVSQVTCLGKEGNEYAVSSKSVNQRGSRVGERVIVWGG